jgi:sterol desaturase/sphingolipid hydroxylase (fatty acid hydroxylase superfamily)
MSLEQLSLLSPIIIVGAAVFYMIMERLFPYTKGQKVFREGFVNDFVFYTLLQSALLSIVIGWIIEGIDALTPVSRLTGIRELPLWQQAIFFLVVHDFYIYWFHRWQHRNEVLWRVHEAHHSPKSVDWVSGSRSHSLEILINQTIEYAPIFLLASPEMAIVKGIMDAVWGMWIHSNIDVKSGWLQRIINGPEMHRWHHAKEITEGGFNFSTKLAVWDWLFGTAYLPTTKPSGYGITDESYPLSSVDTPPLQRFLDDAKSYVKQHLYAFRPLERQTNVNPTPEAQHS